MASCTLNDIFNDVRGFLSDTQVAGGEVFTNSYLPVHFAEPYRSMFKRLMGGSKRVQRVVYVVLPAYTTVLIPSTQAITDFYEPELIEERPAPSPIAIASTDTSTPINVTTSAPHGLGANGSQVLGQLSGVSGTFAPWGNWYALVTGATTFSLNGSASDGVAGTGGAFYVENNQEFVETTLIDQTAAGLDGAPQSTLGSVIWAQERLTFRGATQAIQLRITYNASGTPPTNPNYVITIDDCRDFLAVATAANAARSKGWMTMYGTFRDQAYGDPSHPDEVSLLDLFFNTQVLQAQQDSPRRLQPFRDKRSRFGSYVLG